MILITTLAGIYVLVHSIFCINKMRSHSCNMMWLSYVLISTSVLYALVNIASGIAPSLEAHLLINGMAIRFLFDRRVCGVYS